MILNSAIVTLRFPAIPTTNFTNRTTFSINSSVMKMSIASLAHLIVLRAMTAKLTNPISH